MNFKTAGIVGFGRFGGMAYRHLKERLEVRVFDALSDRLQGIPEATTLEEAASADVVILSVPISEIQAVCRALAPHLRPGQLVADTCSVKEKPISWMESLLPEHTELLGTHPLFGPDSGKNGIRGLRIALCRVRTSDATYAAVCDCLRDLGLELIETTPAEHDRQIAQTQAIFHLIAQAMKRLEWGVQSITTPGPETFFNLIRTVQRDTEQLFRDMERENPYAAECRRRFIQQLMDLDSSLAAQSGRSKTEHGESS